VAKPLMADGSELSHALALVHDGAGLAQLARGDVPGLRLPCVLQEFVDHGGSIFKVYVVGDAVSTTRRRSLPDQRGARAASSSGLEVIERISTLGVHRREQEQLLAAQQRQQGGTGVPADGPPQLASSPLGYHIEGAASVLEPSAAFVRSLALGLKAALGLQLFNFDLIRVMGERDRFLVVDINYFPGIAKMPGYEAVFADFLRRSVEERRAALRAQPPPEPADTN
jgi:inositol-1,3,4-trisphosphate 5/6-kinase/inositol-tetrakisphosphate 1-kinase